MNTPAEAAGMTLGDIVSGNATRFGEVVAYQSGRRTITHAELHRRAVQLVSAMVAAGGRRQDRVVIVARNHIEFGEVLAACYLSGIIAAPVSVRLAAGEMQDAIRRVSPSLVFCDGEYASMVGAVLPDGCRTVVFGSSIVSNCIAYEEFLRSGDRGIPALAAEPDDIAMLLFTSGTTGAAKCCMLGQREFYRVAHLMNAEMRSGADDRGLINMPMFHVGALAIIAGIHARGGTVVLQSQFDPDEALRLISMEQISVLHLAPVMLQRLIDQVVSSGQLTSVRTVLYAAAPMTAPILRAAMATLPAAGFVNLYGQTEAIVSGLPPELHCADTPAALRSVGFPFPGVRLRIVDDHGDDLPSGQPGEIAVRSDTMFRGYWDDHAATLDTVRDGWCYTGDVGRIDQHGLLYLVDRKKDVIITGGENVYSPEVEDVVGEVDGVAACAVVGCADRRWGEAVCAVVVPAPGTAVTLEVIQEAVRRKLARFKAPRKLILLRELPLLASGKVDKKRLRAIIAQQ
jgi:acyl-CoA synthetase (AMP-forming)/AMP-acid ligase II